MTKINRFEELISWQKARDLAGSIYQLTLQGSFPRDYGLKDQILRASGSIMHNIAEGFESGSDAEMVRFLRIARRSASEVQSELYLALDRKHIIPQQMGDAYNLANEVKRLINGLIAYLLRDKVSSPPHRMREIETGYLTDPLEEECSGSTPDNG